MNKYEELVEDLKKSRKRIEEIIEKNKNKKFEQEKNQMNNKKNK